MSTPQKGRGAVSGCQLGSDGSLDLNGQDPSFGQDVVGHLREGSRHGVQPRVRLAVHGVSSRRAGATSGPHRRAAGADPRPGDRSLEADLRECRGDLRRIVSGLTPSALRDSNLELALERVVATFDGQGQHVTLESAVHRGPVPGYHRRGLPVRARGPHQCCAPRARTQRRGARRAVGVRLRRGRRPR